VIASVRGEVVVRRADHVVVECGGVGYRLAVSAHTLRSVPAAGDQTLLHSHLVLRDDGMHLYGFASEEERELFLMLVGVQGVGPKVALAVLSGGSPRELTNAMAAGDSGRFQAVPGIGKRTAERIIVELREKVVVDGAEEARAPIAARRGTHVEGSDGRALARAGLIELGYAPAEADALLAQAEGESADQLISDALRGAHARA